MKSQLERIFERLTSWLDSAARARAASELAHHGYYQAASNLINGKKVTEAN